MKLQMKNIMCTTDLSELSKHAVSYGIALAREFGARLFMCHVVDLPSPAIYGEGIADPLLQESRIMDFVREHLDRLSNGHSIDWEPLIRVGHAATELARMAEENHADIVISATHGRSGLKRLMLGSVTERLMRTLPCPLMVVRSSEQGLTDFADMDIRLKRILVGCDFSADSSLAFKHALSLAQQFQSVLHLAHVLEPLIYEDLLKSGIDPGAEFRKEDLGDQLKEKLISMVPEEAYNWCTPKTALLAGHPHEELTKYAAVHGFDLIVLGVRGHGLIETLFVGSTTDRVVRQAPCPVLSVPPMIHGIQDDNAG
jgi:nucleotide-binding universal stress UspA family protein